MNCENDAKHDPERYCKACATCHECVEEGDEAYASTVERLKTELQKTIDDRNEAWAQLEENNIAIRQVEK